MQNRRTYRIFLTIACFVVAGLSAKKIMDDTYTWLDVVLMIAGVVFGGIYIFMLRKKE